jgi:hypothetical protein
MFKKRRVIVSVFVVLVLMAIGWGWFSGGSSAQVEVVGDLAAKDVKEIKGLVQRQMRSGRVEHVWNMVWDGDIKRIAERVRHDMGYRMKRIEVQANGEVWVYVELPHVMDADYECVLNHTNGWRIVRVIGDGA